MRGFSVTCHCCGRKTRKPYIVRRFYQDGSNFEGHRSCFNELVYPGERSRRRPFWR